MRHSFSHLVVVLMVLALTRPRLVNCRILPLPIKTEKDSHEPVKELPLLRASVTTKKDNMSNRVLAENQVYTMSSGPSRRGSGH